MLMLVAPPRSFVASVPFPREVRRRLFTVWATRHDMRRLPHVVATHRLGLLPDDSPTHSERRAASVRLQPVTSAINGIIIRPGQTFSMSRVLGRRLGRQPADGVATHRVATLLHWMVLHSPLTVVERSEHLFDLSPDEGLPWGVSSSMVHPRATLVIRNDSVFTIQFMTRVDDDHILGELRSEEPLPYSYQVYPSHEEFIQLGDRAVRRNEIWRRVTHRRTGRIIATELVEKNCARVTFDAVTE